MPTITENLQRLVDAKSDIADAITAKGGTVNSGDGFEEFAADIATIPSGGGYTQHDFGLKCSTINNRKITNYQNDGHYYPSSNTAVTFYKDYSFNNLSGYQIWSDGENVYYSNNAAQYVLDKTTNRWKPKTWSGLTSFAGRGVWSDGVDIYYSSGSTQKVLNKSTSTWSTKTWSGLTNFDGANVWTDGEYIYYSRYVSSSDYAHYVLTKGSSTWNYKTWYYSNGNNYYYFSGINVWTDGTNTYISRTNTSVGAGTNLVLDKSTSTWSSKTWYGNFSKSDPGQNFNTDASNIWHDGNNVYCSDTMYMNKNFVLDKSTSRWNDITWNGLTSFSGSYIWSDGVDIYYSMGYNSIQKKLNRLSNTWEDYAIPKQESFNFDGKYVWGDGTNVYYSNAAEQYILNEATYGWETKTWNGLTSFSGSYIWSDGVDIYYSSGSTQKVLNKATSTWTDKTWSGMSSFNGSDVWSINGDIYYSYSTTQYKLNKTTSTWETQTWNGLTPYRGYYIWTDGDDIFTIGYQDSYPYVCTIDIETATVNKHNNNRVASSLADCIKTDGLYFSVKFYDSPYERLYIKGRKTFISATLPSGMYSLDNIWNSNENIYYSLSSLSTSYILPKWIPD